jgi:16S rRNA (uracil1498-N3)-methyltransferase
MTRRRWIADEVSGNRAILTGNHAEHLARVLRARVGQEFDIATGLAVRKSRITSIAESRVEFELGEEVAAAAAAKITLALAVFKFDRMEWAIEKCTELGVAQIVPVIAQRTDVHLAAATIKRTERWRRIARQAAEQSRRAVPPEIAAPVELPEALGLPGDVRIVLAESEEKALLRDVLESLPQEAEIVLAVGPEGGWTIDEFESFHQAGWTSASLGKTVLRAETAAVAATAIATTELS